MFKQLLSFSTTILFPVIIPVFFGINCIFQNAFMYEMSERLTLLEAHILKIENKPIVEVELPKVVLTSDTSSYYKPLFFFALFAVGIVCLYLTFGNMPSSSGGSDVSKALPSPEKDMSLSYTYEKILMKEVIRPANNSHYDAVKANSDYMLPDSARLCTDIICEDLKVSGSVIDLLDCDIEPILSNQNVLTHFNEIFINPYF